MASAGISLPDSTNSPTSSFINTRGRVIGDVASGWIPELTNYQIDYTPKAIILRQKRPTSSHRKNKPHPKHVAHLRRLTNEPVCTVKTIITHGDPSSSSTHIMQSLMKSQFKLPPATPGRATRFGCNKNKSLAASGIVPTPNVLDKAKEEERLLPACAKHTTLMTTSSPFQYVPRKRRITPKVLDESIGILKHPLPDKTPIGKPRPPRKTSRRLVASAPSTTLQVSTFDGGAPPDYNRTITGRKRPWRPAVPGGILCIPGYMKQF
ncbi:uncharacterized protein [Diadema antillarum]|uniref:uncharacterized protein n=1 Tax=Diadema antillarum TaxID=105358 RepID=UPI003A835A35